MPDRFQSEVLRGKVREMERLRDRALAVERALAGTVEHVHPRWRGSARNLAHYVALRGVDLRDLQRALASFGLSSLGRTESHTLASIDAVLATLGCVTGRPIAARLEVPVDFAGGDEQLGAHTRALLGPPPAGRSTRVMVTLPLAAADDPALVRALIEGGMDCARINGAYGDPATRERVARHVQVAARELSRPCGILVDLPGPKLRTAPLPSGPRVQHWKPERGQRGEVLRRARVLLIAEGAARPADAPPHDAVLPLAGADLERTVVGDELLLHDLRRRRRSLPLVATGPGWRLAELGEGLWIESGLPLVLLRHGGRLAEGSVGTLPARETAIALQRGERLLLVPEDVVARPASVHGPARIGCTLREVFRDARPGEPIHFDDGKISGVVRSVVRAGASGPEIEVEITECAAGGAKLRGGKGINLPATQLDVPALTTVDRAILGEAARYADMVGLSFVRAPGDVRELQRALAALDREDMGIVLKIETARAFRDLPRLVMEGMRSPRLGVMVARGDLGVELGFERLAEVQEEILWICEAAHVPVVWATQVLESLARRGRPSRAEVTDAAMSARAECVMLNKGPHVLEAVRFLDDVLRRMEGHQHKKFSIMRRLAMCDIDRAGVPPPSDPAIAPASDEPRASPAGRGYEPCNGAVRASP